MKLTDKPTYIDTLILSVFTILITLHPFYMHGKINLFEVGLYLPGIQAVLNGEVPFRDFFHLRGPFEIYMPALLMKLFGTHIKYLYLYFYVGTILCLIGCIFVAKELLKTRYVLYLMTPVLVGRTFPRIVFTYWGGMRYAFGIWALWMIIVALKRQNSRWMFWAGLTCALGLFTSIEVGIYVILGVLASLIVSKIFNIQETKHIIQFLKSFFAGILLVVFPYSLYLIATGAFFPYCESVFTIVTRMQDVIDPHFVSIYPRNFIEALVAMLNPVHTNFKHMTPSYLYIIVLAYLVIRLRAKKIDKRDLFVVALGVYGFVMYNTGFRGIWAAQFEMALQPEKILLFFLLEYSLLSLIKKKPMLKSQLSSFQGKAKHWIWGKIILINFFTVVLCASSIGYVIQRFNHRFYAFQFVRNKLTGRDTESLKRYTHDRGRSTSIAPIDGVIVPLEQAFEFEAIDNFVKEHVKSDEPIFTYPETGTYNFLVNRRFVGRFPLATMSWFNEKWHQELLADLEKEKPPHIILKKDISQYWKDVYLAIEPNRQKFREMMAFIHDQYELAHETPSSKIYRIKQTRKDN